MTNDDKGLHRGEEGSAAWWEASLTRRQAGAVAVGAAVAVGLTGCCGDDLGDIEEHDSLELQKKQGWAVGEDALTLSFFGSKTQDSSGSTGWKDFVDAKKLMAVARPSQKAWQPFERTVLFQALEQKSFRDQVKPVHTDQMEAAYVRGAAMVSLITSVKDPEQTLLLLDMPGPQAVALAASMAENVEPVFFFDNWPHPKGVVKSHEALGAVVYYASELERKRKAREGRKVPVALVFDSRRLSPYKDASDQFDNRYLAEIPDASTLKKLGIGRTLYITERPVKNEADDLNDAIVSLSENRVQVASLSLDAFQKDPNAPEEARKSTGGYFYGGGYHHHPHFFAWYPMFLFFPIRGSRWSSSPRAPARVSKPSYKPQARKTSFSSSTRGAKSGVGRRKPVGFGRVSTRMSGSGKPVRVNKSGARTTPTRSGSRGRSRGGFGG